MTTSKKAVSSTNNSAVTISAPKIEIAWINACTVSTTSETSLKKAVALIGKEMKASQLSVRDIQKVIKATGLESAFIKVSHVEGIPTLCDMAVSVKGFAELPLAKQLSTAVASYKLLGVGVGQELASVEILEKEIARERKVKNTKSTTPKSTPVKEAKNPLVEILAYFTALDFSTLAESEQDLIAEINAIVESKMINA